MELPPLNKRAQSMARLGAVVLFFSTFIMGVVGYSVRSIHDEIKILNQFMINAEEVQPNFESSLQLYTENTEKAIAFVHDLRPDDELDYIAFISELESLGQSLGMKLSLSSDEAASGVDGTGSNSLVYEVQSYGSYDQLVNLMSGLESMPYYLRIDSFEYASLSSLDASDLERPNVSLNLRLYVE